VLRMVGAHGTTQRRTSRRHKLTGQEEECAPLLSSQRSGADDDGTAQFAEISRRVKKQSGGVVCVGAEARL
jgi:hypothetical protein